ncbi:hypothetical protein C2S53_020811, partial [Perilla frutescens var. hirtella]
MHVGFLDKDHMADVLVQLFSRILGQLQTLNIETRRAQRIWDTDGFDSIVKMGNLKQLVVTYLVSDVNSFLPLAYVILAAPCFRKFVFK